MPSMKRVVSIDLSKVKELESQLLIERKLARQHVDTKIAEQQQQQQKQQEPNISLVNPQSVIRPLLGKYHDHVGEQVRVFKDLGSLKQPLVEHNINRTVLIPPADINGLKYVPLQKENKPELAEDPLPRNANRVSLCSTAKRVPVTPAPRRNSLIPIPAVKAVLPQLLVLANVTDNLSAPLPSPLPDIINTKDGLREGESNICESRSTKKFASILRRSLQKKVIIRSPLPHSIRRGSTLGGLEKVRLSITGSGRKAQRVLVSDAPKSDRVVQQKRQQKEKERGWNHGMAARNVFN